MKRLQLTLHLVLCSLILLSSGMASAGSAAPASQIGAPFSSRHIDFVEQIGGQGQAVTVVDGVAYQIIGPRLFLLDVASAPGHVTAPVIGYTDPLSNMIEDIEISGSYAYLAAWDSGLLIVDISNPAAPALIGSYDSGGQTYDVFVEGNIVYMADGFDGIRSVDISDKRHPQELNHFSTDIARKLVIVDKYLYVADSSQLLVVDKSNPASLQLVDSISIEANDLALDGDSVYVTTKSALRQVEVIDPANPVLTSNQAAGGWALCIGGEYAYIVSGDWTTYLLRVIHLKTFNEIETYQSTHSIAAVTVDANNWVYVSSYEIGMSILGWNGGNLEFSGGFFTEFSSLNEIDAAGDTLYVSAGNAGMVMFDVSDASAPDYLDSKDTANGASGLDVYSDYAYVADFDGGLRILQATSPYTEVGSINTPDPDNIYFYDVDVSAPGIYFGDPPIRAYVGSNSGFRVYSVTDPLNIGLLGSYAINHITTVKIRQTIMLPSSTTAYLASDDGFFILNVGNPGSITKLSEWTDSGGVEDLTYQVLGAKVFVYLATFEGVDILDVTDPANILQVARYPLEDCQAIEVLNHQLAVGTDKAVWVFDVSDLSSPKPIGYYTIGDWIEDVKPIEDQDITYLYVATNSNGLYVLRLMEHQVYLPLLKKE